MFPIVCVVLLVVVWLMFRRLWPVFISGLVSFIGVLWTMAVAVLIDNEISIMHTMTPIVIAIASKPERDRHRQRVRLVHHLGYHPAGSEQSISTAHTGAFESLRHPG